MTDDGRDGDPHERLRALQRRAYAADGDAAGDRAVAGEIRELQARIKAERVATGIAGIAGIAGSAGGPGGAGRALSGVSRSRDEARAPQRRAGHQDSGDPVLHGSERGTEHDGATIDGTETDLAGADLTDADLDPGAGGEFAAGPAGEAAAGEHVRRPRHRLLSAVTLAGALMLGVLLGGAASAAIRPHSPAPTPDSTTPDSTSSGDTPAAPGAPARAAQVFTRLQTAKDIPLVEMPETFIAASFRYLGSAGWTDADADGVTDSPYYAARSGPDLICLVVVPEGSGYLSTCAPEAAYPSAGLRLSWQSTDLHPGVPDGTLGMVLDVTVTWLSDSTVETRGAGRPVPVP